MNNKKLWLVSALLLFGVLPFYFYKKPSGTGILPITKERAAPIARPAQNTANQEAAIKRNQYAVQEHDKLMAENSKFRTPKVQKLLVDALMKSRKLEYQSLFDSWELDNDSRDLVLNCVYEREYGRKEALRKLGINGRAGTQNFAADVEAEKRLAEFQIETILGAERAQEFYALESKMDNRMRSQAQKLTNSSLAD